MKVVYDVEKRMYTVTIEDAETTLYINADSDAQAKREYMGMMEMLFDNAIYNNITVDEVIDYFRGCILNDTFSEKITNYISIAINALEKCKKGL